jgi:hypothetical protein
LFSDKYKTHKYSAAECKILDVKPVGALHNQEALKG